MIVSAAACDLGCRITTTLLLTIGRRPILSNRRVVVLWGSTYKIELSPHEYKQIITVIKSEAISLPMYV